MGRGSGHMEGNQFHPHSEKKGVSRKSISKSSTGGEEMKGLPKSFRGYDVMNRKKVLVKKDIKKIRMKNGRPALQGTSPLPGHITITHIIPGK